MYLVVLPASRANHPLAGQPLRMEETIHAASGRQLHLRAGELTATVVQVGAGLRELAVGGQPLLDGYGEDEIAAFAQGQALVPWPNRLAVPTTGWSAGSCPR